MKEHSKEYLKKKIEQLEHLCTVDELTGLYNSACIKRILRNEVYRAKRYKRALSVIVIDVDDFKKINDTQGHLKGDSILKRLSKLLKSNTRKSDIIGRFGGDEIMIVLPETIFYRATKVAEELKEFVAKKLNISISVGVSAYPQDGKIAKTLFKTADKNMYEDKQGASDE